MNKKLFTILSAGMVLNTSFATAQDININTATFHAQQGVALGADQTGGGLKNLLKYEKELVFNILERLGVGNVSASVRNDINKMQTNNVDALLAYSQGLDHKDHGRYDQAKESFAAARSLDPGFGLAHHAFDSMPEIQNMGQIQQASMVAGQGNAKSAESKDDSDLTTKQDEPASDGTEGEGSAKKSASSLLGSWLSDMLTFIPSDIPQNLAADNFGGDGGSIPRNPNLDVPLETFDTSKVWLTSVYIQTANGLVLNPFFTSSISRSTAIGEAKNNNFNKNRDTIYQRDTSADGTKGYVTDFETSENATPSFIAAREANTPFEDQNLDVKLPDSGPSGNFTYSSTSSEILGTWYGDEIAAFTVDGNSVQIPGGVFWGVDANFTPTSTLGGFTNENAYYSYYASSPSYANGFMKGTIARDNGGSVVAENVTGGLVSGTVDFSGKTVPGKTVPGTVYPSNWGTNFFIIQATSANYYAQATYGNGLYGTLNNDGSFSLAKAQMYANPGSVEYRSGIGLGNPCAVGSTPATTTIPDSDVPDNMNVTGQVVGSTGNGIVGAYAIDRNGSDGKWAAFGVFGGTCPSSYCP